VKQTRWIALAMGAALVVGACGGGKSTTDNAGTGSNSTSQSTGAATTTVSPAQAKCAGATLTASETGVTASTITIGSMADTGSSIRPGLFLGSIDAMKAWATYKNAHGGVGCRKVVVKVGDSKLSSDEAKNFATQSCSNALAMVGTTALFFNDMSPLTSCKDKAGKATGLPDLPVLQTEPVQQCSTLSYAVLPGQGSCPYSGTGVRTFKAASGPFDYYLKKFGNTLHGVWIIPRDLPSTISASMPGFRYSQQLGIKLDAEFGESGLATEDKYTPYAQAIKQHNSTYARVGLDYKGTVYLRKEAATQGVSTVKVWDCSVQCYDKRLISEGGSAVDGQYVWLSILPFEDKGSNATLDNFLQYDTKPDGFGAQAWAAAELFAQAIDTIVADQGPNAITRANLLAAVRNIHDFTAGGMIPPTDVGGKTGTKCFVMMQVQSAKFVRVEPTKPGTFNCDGKVGELTMDPLKAFKG
jgi:hypothetical protein